MARGWSPVRCPRCRHENPGEARFCVHCGVQLSVSCASCGVALPPDARFCSGCGRAVAAAPVPAGYTPRHISEQILAVRSAIAGERKQVSVLFCDIVSSSALAAELGPEEFHLVIDRFFRIALAEVHRYEGTVNQFLGDGFMALFGAPSTPAECSLPRSNYSRNQPGPWPKTPYTHGTQTSRRNRRIAPPRCARSGRPGVPVRHGRDLPAAASGSERPGLSRDRTILQQPRRSLAKS